jgi:hypothetical protein
MKDDNNIPIPERMPIDRERWAKDLHLSNFVNSYYQYRDLRRLRDCKKVLIVGPGQGLDACVLKWCGYDIHTFDIDEAFKPDHIGSVHDLSRFQVGAFDAVVASHVLEHLALPYLDRSLQELARVARYALIYLPVHGRHAQFRLIPGFGGFDWSIVTDLFNWFEKPDGLTRDYMSGQHYWEVGMRGFRVHDLIGRFSANFDVLENYRNRDWLPSQNFVLRSKRTL